VFKLQCSDSNVPYINSSTIVPCQKQLEWGRCEGNAVCIRELKNRDTLEMWVEMQGLVTEKPYSLTLLSGNGAETLRRSRGFTQALEGLSVLGYLQNRGP